MSMTEFSPIFTAHFNLPNYKSKATMTKLFRRAGLTYKRLDNVIEVKYSK